MPASKTLQHNWGTPPWVVDFHPPEQVLPREADFIVVGAGFTGLAAAAWLRLLDNTKSVVVLEAGRIGHGASGRTGGMALAETAAGNLPGLGDVLGGIEKIFAQLEVGCDLVLTGAWEISRKGGRADSPICWQDSGTLRVVNEVPGGTLDPGKLVSGLARAAHLRGAAILENHRVVDIAWSERPVLRVERGSARDRAEITAGKILFATNGVSLELSGLSPRAPEAHACDSHRAAQRGATAIAWPCREQTLLHREFFSLSLGPHAAGPVDRVGRGTGGSSAFRKFGRSARRFRRAAEMFARFEKRVLGLHPAAANVAFTHHWGGPILFRDNWEPVFDWHPESRNALVIGAFAGHGVALSNYLGAWAAEILLGRRSLPTWGKL